MKRILIATVVGLAALSAGCNGTAGEAKPDPSTGTSTSSSASGSGLASMKSCDLLTESDVTGLGLTYPGKQRNLGSSESCYWSVSGNGGLGAGIRADTGVKDLDAKGERLSEIKVGKFTATKVEAQNGDKTACAVLISVTESSSVSVISTLSATSTDTAASCERATKAADLIAAKLP
jgi:predicted small secreted protein